MSVGYSGWVGVGGGVKDITLGGLGWVGVGALFDNAPHETIFDRFSRVLGGRLKPYVSIKKWLHQRQFLEVLGNKRVPVESL